MYPSFNHRLYLLNFSINYPPLLYIQLQHIYSQITTVSLRISKELFNLLSYIVYIYPVVILPKIQGGVQRDLTYYVFIYKPQWHIPDSCNLNSLHIHLVSGVFTRLQGQYPSFSLSFSFISLTIIVSGLREINLFFLLF